jgi:hypothetical protein
MKKIKLLLPFVFAIAIILTFASCGGNGDLKDPDSSDVEITGISFNDAAFNYDGTEKSIAISGTLPEGVTVVYTNEKATDAGVYNATAKLSGEGYKSLTLNATLTINKLTISSVSFDDSTFTFDGTEKSMAVSGSIPEGVTVVYTNEKATDAGVYNATAKLSGKNYEELTLNAKLTINKASITGITAEAEQKADYDDTYHKPTYLGTVPNGVTVKYYFDNEVNTDGVKDVGTYAVKIVFEGKNYTTLTLEVSYEIKQTLTGLANMIINSFGSVPDVWAFLPEGFSLENRNVNISSPIDYSSFVNVSNIPTNGMGKQLNMVYGLLSKMQTATSYVNTVYGAMNAIKTLYINYLNDNPDNYQTFTANAGPFTFTIELDDSAYHINATIGTVEIAIFSDTSNGNYGAKVKLTDTTVLKYTVADDSLTIALNILNVSSTMIEFARNDANQTVGYIYEYISALGFDIVATSAMIHVGDTYTTIIGTKGDFIPTSDSRNCEIYLNSTGMLVGTEVKEDVQGVIFNTYWFPLIDLNGVDTIKKIDERNSTGLNADTIFINGSSTELAIKKFGGLNLKTASRAFDIEFKTMYFFNYDENSGEYIAVESEIPMLFIQEEKYSSFVNDFNDVNENCLNGNATLTVSSVDINAIAYAYSEILPVYNTIKDTVTREYIIQYCTQ